MKIFMHCPYRMISTPRSLNHVIFRHDEQPAAEEGNQKSFCLHASLGTSSAVDNNETARVSKHNTRKRASSECGIDERQSPDRFCISSFLLWRAGKPRVTNPPVCSPAEMSLCVHGVFTWKEPLTEPSAVPVNTAPDRLGTSPGLSETETSPSCEHTQPRSVWNRDITSCEHLEHLLVCLKQRHHHHVNTCNPGVSETETSPSCEHLEHLLVCLKQRYHCHVNMWNILFV